MGEEKLRIMWTLNIGVNVSVTILLKIMSHFYAFTFIYSWPQ